ncbi:MAG: hypothetical protein HZB31_02320 [Nitrospirae bacterium]|nr:hypothetical protein [Nitrospirota bacterium]
MKILHILNDGPTELSDAIIREQQKEHEIRIIDLSKTDLSYDMIIDDIFSFDRVMSWQR